MTKEELKQWAEDVSKAYDILAFGSPERAAEILAKTRNAMRYALAKPEQDIPKIGCVNHDCDKCNMSGWRKRGGGR